MSVFYVFSVYSVEMELLQKSLERRSVRQLPDFSRTQRVMTNSHPDIKRMAVINNEHLTGISSNLALVSIFSCEDINILNIDYT